MFRQNTAIIVTGLISLSVIFGIMYRKVSITTSLLISYFFANAIFQFIFNPSIMTRKNATTWLMESLILLLMAEMLLNKDTFLKVAVKMYWLLSITALCSALYYFEYGFGLIDASSFEAAMLIFTVLLPAYSESLKLKWLRYALIILGLYIGGSTGMAILAVYILGEIFYSKSIALKLFTAMSIPTIAYHAYLWTDIFNDSGRFDIWATYLGVWFNNFDMTFGTGIGSFKNIATQVKTANGTFLYAHNDFLEIFLETGFVGLVIASILCLKLMIYAYRARMVHYCFMMFVFMGNYFPNQILLTKAIFLLCIVTIYIRGQNEISIRNY